jgi:Rrf2 family protein
MRLSKKTDYALRALFTLIEHEGRGPVSIRALAESNDVPKAFLEHILLDLKERGWVTSTPGKAGGYQLAQPAERITMGMVIRHFDGVLAPIGCVSKAAYEPCSQEARCRFRRALLEVRNMTARYMDQLTLAEVFRQKPVSPAELADDMLLIAGAGI